MTNKNLKSLVEQIKKLASPPPAPPGGHVAEVPVTPAVSPGGAGEGAGMMRDPSPGGLPGHGGQSAPSAPSGRSQSAPNKSIAQMQSALQNLAKTISATIDYNALVKTMQAPPTPEQQKQLGPGQQAQDVEKFKAQYGKDMFSNFMVNKYLRNSPVQGVEYDNTKTQMDDKNPSTPLKSMYNILETMQRVGNPKVGEQFVDGAWGPRTNNALQNATAIAYAVTQLGKDLGMEMGSIDPNIVNVLGQLVPKKANDIDQKEKLDRAPQLTEILNGVNTLFLNFKQQVFQQPALRNLIEGKAPFMTIGPDKGPATGGEIPILKDLQQNGSRSGYVNQANAGFQITLSKQLIPPQFQNAPMDIRPITGADLVSKEAFENWVNNSKTLSNIKNNNPATWPSVAVSILDQVKAQASQKATSRTGV